jgi:hypothetical protein
MRLDEGVEEAFVGTAPDLSKLKRAKRRELHLEGCRVEGDGGRAEARDDVVFGDAADRGERDEAGTVELEHKTATDHVAKLAVGLAPVPGLAEVLGEGAAAGAWVLSDERADEVDIGGGDRATAVLERDVHGGRE